MTKAHKIYTHTLKVLMLNKKFVLSTSQMQFRFACPEAQCSSTQRSCCCAGGLLRSRCCRERRTLAPPYMCVCVRRYSGHSWEWLSMLRYRSPASSLAPASLYEALMEMPSVNSGCICSLYWNSGDERSFARPLSPSSAPLRHPSLFQVMVRLASALYYCCFTVCTAVWKRRLYAIVALDPVAHCPHCFVIW